MQGTRLSLSYTPMCLAQLHDLLAREHRSHYEVIQNDEKFSVISAGKYYEIPDKVDINEDDLPL